MTTSPTINDWWKSAVVYQVYPRSFADSNGDGIGDVRGIIDHLDHLVTLGVDALWISPWYPSPMADGGYDVSDYCDINPDFGTLADADALVAQAHELGLRVIIDLVPNHSSQEHPWFKKALAAAPGSPERDRYIFRDGRGENGELPRTAGRQFSAAAHGSASPSRTALPVSGTYTFLTFPSPTGTGRTPTSSKSLTGC